MKEMGDGIDNLVKHLRKGGADDEYIQTIDKSYDMMDEQLKKAMVNLTIVFSAEVQDIIKRVSELKLETSQEASLILSMIVTNLISFTSSQVMKLDRLGFNTREAVCDTFIDVFKKMKKGEVPAVGGYKTIGDKDEEKETKTN